MVTAHFFPNCKNLILKIYICKNRKTERRQSTIKVYTYINKSIYVCTDMARNRRIYHHSNEKEKYRGKIIIKKKTKQINKAFLMGWNANGNKTIFGDPKTILKVFDC